MKEGLDAGTSGVYREDMSKNPNGSITRSNMEWGSKARKEEDRLRGTRRRGRVENINEQVADTAEED